MKKTKDSLFHKGAFLDALKKMIIPAIVTLMSITMIECMFIYMVDTYWGKYGFMVEAKDSFERLAFPYLFSFMISVPILMLYCFRYQNDRAMSDRIHSLPIKKSSLAFSNTVAIILISACILSFGFLLVKGAGIVIPGILQTHNENIGLLLGWYMAAMVYSTAMILLAISIGGTWVSTLCMYGILMVVPGALIGIWEYCVLENSTCIMNGFRGTLLDWHLNAATFLINSFRYSEDYFVTKSVSGIVYTLIVGVLLFILALILFEKRPSETSGHATVSDKVHRIFRYTLGGTILCCVFSAHDHIQMFDRVYHPKIIILLITIIFYLLYEYLIQRSLKSCIRSISGLVFVILFAVVFYGTIMLGKRMIANVLPDADQVCSVRIIDMDRGYVADYYYTKLTEYTIRDPEAIEILCEAVSKTEKQELANKWLDPVLRERSLSKLDGFRCKKINETVDDSFVITPNIMARREPIRDAFEEKGREKWLLVSFDGIYFFRERKVHLEQEDLEKLVAVLEKDETFRDIFLKPVSRECVESIKAVPNDCSYSKPPGDLEELYELYTDTLVRYGNEDFLSVVYQGMKIYPYWGTEEITYRGDACLYVKLNDGKQLWVSLQGADADAWHYSYIEKEDALLEVYKDIFLTYAEPRLTELAKDAVHTEVIITVDLYNIVSDSDETPGEISFCTYIEFDDGEWHEVDTADEWWPGAIWSMLRCTRYWNGWEVTDTSAPYAKVTYTVNQQKIQDAEAQCIKECETEYRLEPEDCEWIFDSLALTE